MAAGILALPQALRGQAMSPTMSDATVVSRGALRFRGEIQWTRIDGSFGVDGSGFLSRGSAFSGNLTSSALPLLSDGESAARILAGDPALTLSAGRLTTSVDSRIVSVPLSVEYGLTSRLTVGVTIPIVQSRGVVTAQLNGPADSIANVGTNPAAFHGSSAAYTANSGVFNGLTAAGAQLAQRVSDCAANPALSGCDAVNARAAEASALLTATVDFAAAVATLYGVSEDLPGSPFVPLASSAAQTAINARLDVLRAGYTSFGISGGSSTLAAAAGVAANAQLSRIITDDAFGIGLDSLGTTQQTTVGDIELSVTGLLYNSFASPGSLRLRAVAGGIVRLGTGHPARANRPFDVPTGDGQLDLEARGAVDAQTGRLLTTVAATYTMQTGSVATTRLPYAAGSGILLTVPVAGSIKPGNMASLRINPRYMVTPGLMLGALGVASFRAADEVTVTGTAPAGMVFGNPNGYSVYSGGLTVSYSNLASASGTGTRDFPAEIVFTHLETLSATAAGAEKSYRDTIELRYYFRTRR